MKFQELETERLILRVLTPEVYDFVFTTNSDKEIINFFNLNSKKELEEEKLKYKNGVSSFSRSFLIFQIIDKESLNVIGWCGFHVWYVEHHRAELGYKLTNDLFKKKGIMTEALKEVVKYGFDSMLLNRIEAFVGPDNFASLKLIHNLNFVKEGHLRGHYLRNGVYEDSLIFSLLK